MIEGHKRGDNHIGLFVIDLPDLLVGARGHGPLDPPKSGPKTYRFHVCCMLTTVLL